MDIKDKLAYQRKEREVHKRGRSIEDAWSKIKKSDDLSTKEKLERLINLTGAAKPKPKAAVPEWRAEEPEKREPLQYFENSFSSDVRYGRIKVGAGLRIDGETLYYLGRDEEFQELGLDTALFLDLETTGLAGGTGTIPFLVGLGYYRGDKFVVAQYFLGEPGEEERMLEDLARLFEEGGFRSVVTYNGKAFDLPLLETRFILKRKPFKLGSLPHLDFLFSARNLWRHKHESCGLFHLAREVVAADRSEDIPGAEIPFRYFDYLRTGDFSQIEPILYHNQEDILSLLGLLIQGARLFKSGRAPREEEEEDGEALDAMDLVGVGRLFEKVGDIEQSVVLFERAVSGGLTGQIETTIKYKLSTHLKKTGEWDRAVIYWNDLKSMDKLFAFRELAMYFEHQARNFAEALRTAEEGLFLAQKTGDPFEEDFLKRITRLQTKIERLGEAPSLAPVKPRKARIKKG
ncbi:MAG: ribonuclease H-like domain-containing protein [Acidobacteriota bacterium]|nr:ribonuclease H-like domain-containing protein [Acidobacteriota bacterium]